MPRITKYTKSVSLERHQVQWLRAKSEKDNRAESAIVREIIDYAILREATPTLDVSPTKAASTNVTQG